MVVLVCTILLLLLQAPTTLEQGPGGKATITQGISEALDKRMRSGGYYLIKEGIFKSQIGLRGKFNAIPKNITKMASLTKTFAEIHNHFLSKNLTLVNSTRGVRVCCKNQLNLEDTLDKTFTVKVSRQESCVIREDNEHHIGNWTIKHMPRDIRYLVTVTAIKTGETVIYPSVDICHDDLRKSRLESTELIKTRPKDVVIVLDMSRIMKQSTFKDSNQQWMEAQGQILNKTLGILSERDRVIVVATQSGRRFTSHSEDSCHSKHSLSRVYNEFKEHFEMLESNGTRWDDSDNSDLVALINHLDNVFDDFPKLQHKRAKIAVVFVASNNVSKENNNKSINNPFLKRINLISICVGNIPGSNRPYTTDAVIKQHLKKYGSYLGVSSMDVVEGFADWFNQKILPIGTIISRTGLFPGIGPVLKMCYRREGDFVCLLVPVATIQRAVKWSRYIKSYWILLDEFCRVLIHPNSSYRGRQISDDLRLYEPELSITMSEPGCKITPEYLDAKEVNSKCEMIRGTNLTLCLIMKKKDFEMELYPGQTKDGSTNTPLSEGDCRYRDVIFSASPTVTINSDSVSFQPAIHKEGIKREDERRKPKGNVKSLSILKHFIGDHKEALSTFIGLIDGVFIMKPGSKYTQAVDFTTKQWWKLARQNPNQTIVLPPYKIENPIIWTNPTITVARAIMLEKSVLQHKGGEPSYHLLGVFGMVFDFYTLEAVFKQALSNMCSNGQKSCFIIDHNGYIVYHQKLDFHKHRKKHHITEQEPLVARPLYDKDILQKHKCTDTSDLVEKVVPIWKVRPPKYGSENFGKGNTIYSVNQTNLYVIEVDPSQASTLKCDCPNDKSDHLCSCYETISFQPCKNIEESLPVICSPRHPDELIAIEIKPDHTKIVPRCSSLHCAELAIDGKGTCEENKCHWCAMNHTFMCSEDERCIFSHGFTTVPTTHPLEKYTWIGIAVAGAIILLLSLIAGCHIRTYLRDRKKETFENGDFDSISTRYHTAGLPYSQERPAPPVDIGFGKVPPSRIGSDATTDTGIEDTFVIHDTDSLDAVFCERCHVLRMGGWAGANSCGPEHGMHFHADNRHGMASLDQANSCGHQHGRFHAENRHKMAGLECANPGVSECNPPITTKL